MNQSILISKVTDDRYKATEAISKFRAQGTQGLVECKIKSIIRHMKENNKSKMRCIFCLKIGSTKFSWNVKFHLKSFTLRQTRKYVYLIAGY